MEINLSDKVAIITGGSKGIGAGLVRKFAANGCKVYFSYLKQQEYAMRIQEELCSAGMFARAFRVDSASAEEVKNFVSLVAKEQNAIDILINNAGYIPRGLFLNTGDDIWNTAMQTNLNGVYNYCKNVLKYMIMERKGTIINMSTVSALHPNIGQSAYATSKAAIETLTKTIALEYGKYNVRANTIAPGLVNTEVVKSISEEVKKEYISKTPLARVAEIEEIVDIALFLSSDYASYITGSQIMVTGGRHLI